jgi:hypothetical protein
MADVHRRHTLIDAPLETVWSVVSDPRTHPDWWPEVEGVRADLIAGELTEGSEYTRRVRRYGFLDVVDNVWKVERMEQLKECHFRCTKTGSYTRFALTPAQDDTFVEIEAGVDPTDMQGRILRATSTLWMNRWLRDLLEALPEAVHKSTAGTQT